MNQCKYQKILIMKNNKMKSKLINFKLNQKKFRITTKN